jgi:hypothetical protein
MRWLGRNPRAFGFSATMWSLLGVVLMVVWSVWWGLLFVALGAGEGTLWYLGWRRDQRTGR